jgi:hypothetical protein
MAPAHLHRKLGQAKLNLLLTLRPLNHQPIHLQIYQSGNAANSSALNVVKIVLSNYTMRGVCQKKGRNVFIKHQHLVTTRVEGFAPMLGRFAHFLSIHRLLLFGKICESKKRPLHFFRLVKREFHLLRLIRIHQSNLFLHRTTLKLFPSNQRQSK